MKKMLFALIFTPALAYGQFPTFDTLYLKTDTMFADTLKVPNYREHLEQAFDDGSTKIQEREIGDSLTTLNYYVNEAIEINRIFAYYAALTTKKREALHAMNAYAGALEHVGLPDLWDGIQAKFESQYIGKANIIEAGKDVVKGEVTKSNSGVLRLKFGDFNSRILVLSDKMIRVFSYPIQGELTDMYLVRPGVFTSIDRELTIKFK